MTDTENTSPKPKKRAAKPGTTMGVQMRGRLTSQYNKRGHGNANLALHYSFKSGRRDVVLVAMVQLMHFCHAESDPDVVSINYNPSDEVTRIAGGQFADLVHASVKLKDGSTVWRRLIGTGPDKNKEAQELASFVGQGSMSEVSRLEVITEDLLAANPMRLRNSLRACAWIATARHWGLSAYKHAVLELVMRREARMEAILALGDENDQALYGAAAMELAFRGAVQHDLFHEPLTEATRFYPVRRAHD